jgi:hypothetical protein
LPEIVFYKISDWMSTKWNLQIIHAITRAEKDWGAESDDKVHKSTSTTNITEQNNCIATNWNTSQWNIAFELLRKKVYKCQCVLLLIDQTTLKT